MPSVNRTKTEKYILDQLEKLFPGTGNTEATAAFFKSMNDRDFDRYMQALEKGFKREGEYGLEENDIRPTTLRICIPNFTGKMIDVKRMLDASTRLGRPLRQKLILTDNATGTLYETPKEYLCLLLPLRGQEQLLDKKKNIPKDNKHVDDLSGQVTSESQASKLSYPELQMIYAQNMHHSITELLKFRGGDLEAMRAMNKIIAETGSFRQESYPMESTRPKSVETASTMLTGQHYMNNF